MNYLYIQSKHFSQLKSGQFISLELLVDLLDTLELKIIILSIWVEETPTQDYSIDTIVCLIFYHGITFFGCLEILTNNERHQFLNFTITTLTQEFMIQHHKINIYYSQANGKVEAFINNLEHGLTKVFSTNFIFEMNESQWFFGITK